MSTNNLIADEEARADAHWAQRCSALRNAWVQVRYHRSRQRFFDLIDKLSKSLTIVLGASLMGQYFTPYLPWMASAITSIGLLALVFGYSERKQLHKELAEQAAKLVSDIERTPEAGLSAQVTANWNADYIGLCAKAPPPLKTLTLICEREQSTADGHPDHVPEQPFLWRALRHIC